MFRCCGCEERVSGHKKLLRHLLVCAAVKLEEVFEEKTIYENRDLENMNIWKWRVWEVELRAHKRKIKDDKAKEKTRRKKIFQPQKWVGVVTYPKTAGR